MADIYEVTTTVGRTEVLAGRIYRTRTSGSFVRLRLSEDARGLRTGARAGAVPRGAAVAAGQPVRRLGAGHLGRKVQNRAAGRRLDELTLMFGVNDERRQGATRFWENGVAIAAGEGVPVEADLAEIISVADQVERGDTDIDDVAVRRLFRATGSLGGARPKANVRIGTDLRLAKFPKPVGDDWNVMAWEAAMYEAMGRSASTSLHMRPDGSWSTVRNARCCSCDVSIVPTAVRASRASRP